MTLRQERSAAVRPIKAALRALREQLTSETREPKRSVDDV
jgi:hypothetical protein